MVSHPKDNAYLASVVPKRLRLFMEIQARHAALPSDPIKITLPDGKVVEGKKWVTSPFDVAKEISKSSASNALISEVNGVLWDMTRPLEGDCDLKLFTMHFLALQRAYSGRGSGVWMQAVYRSLIEPLEERCDHHLSLVSFEI